MSSPCFVHPGPYPASSPPLEGVLPPSQGSSPLCVPSAQPPGCQRILTVPPLQEPYLYYSYCSNGLCYDLPRNQVEGGVYSCPGITGYSFCVSGECYPLPPNSGEGRIYPFSRGTSLEKNFPP